MIDGYTRVCGLIGSPVEHTLSPVIHNLLARRLGDNLVYVPFHVPDGKEGDAINGAFALNLLGCNVTVPYKSRVIPYLDQIDQEAARIGAVNTLVRTENGFKGYNTDMPGLYRAMRQEGVGIEGEHVLILGAGGVARAVAVLMAEKGAERILILNRTLPKAQAIAEEVNALTGGRKACAALLTDYKREMGGNRFLAIQATSVGMFPHGKEAVIEEEAFYDRIHTGYDLIFNPAVTRFMQFTDLHGGKTYNGAKMLLFQGIIAYELWTGKTVSEQLAQEVYVKLMEGLAAPAAV